MTEVDRCECGAPILLAQSSGGVQAAFDVEPTSQGSFRIEAGRARFVGKGGSGPLYAPHALTCALLIEWREDSRRRMRAER